MFWMMACGIALKYTNTRKHLYTWHRKHRTYRIATTRSKSTPHDMSQSTLQLSIFGEYWYRFMLNDSVWTGLSGWTGLVQIKASRPRYEFQRPFAGDTSLRDSWVIVVHLPYNIFVVAFRMQQRKWVDVAVKHWRALQSCKHFRGKSPVRIFLYLRCRFFLGCCCVLYMLVVDFMCLHIPFDLDLALYILACFTKKKCTKEHRFHSGFSWPTLLCVIDGEIHPVIFHMKLSTYSDVVSSVTEILWICYALVYS